jgi:Fe-S-cluster containining protein
VNDSTDEGREIIAEQRRNIVEQLRTAKTQRNIVSQVRHATDQAEFLITAYKNIYPPSREVQCCKGCFWCCHQTVAVTIPEVLRIAQYILNTLSEEQIKELKDLLKWTIQQIQGLRGIERYKKKIPCPLLVNGACSVHEARPLVCRAFTSVDLQKCIEMYNDASLNKTIPLYRPQRDIALWIEKGLIQGFEEIGLDMKKYELTTSLYIVLCLPEAAEMWLQGREIFDPTLYTKDGLSSKTTRYLDNVIR